MKVEFIKKMVTIIFVLILASSMIWSLQIDYDDKVDSPMNDFYRENAETTGASNLVEAIILDYRAYDTFGEVMVLYIAIAGVIILSKRLGGWKEGDEA